MSQENKIPKETSPFSYCSQTQSEGHHLTELRKNQTFLFHLKPKKCLIQAALYAIEEKSKILLPSGHGLPAYYSSPSAAFLASWRSVVASDTQNVTSVATSRRKSPTTKSSHLWCL